MQVIENFFLITINCIVGCAGSRRCVGFPLGAASRGCSLDVVRGLSLQRVLLCGAGALGHASFSSCGWHMGSIVMVGTGLVVSRHVGSS